MSKKTVLTEYRLKGGMPPMRFVFISDIHERVPVGALRKIRELKPDFIVIAGDTLERYDPEIKEAYEKKRRGRCMHAAFVAAYYVNYVSMALFCRGNRPSTEETYDFLSGLSAVAPVFMSLGNHEQKLLKKDVELFGKLNICLLDNSYKEFYLRGEKLIIGGFSTFYDEDFVDRFARLSGYKILLCHHPSYYDKFNLSDKASLVLAGHNHGGQIRLFNRGIFSSEDGLFPKYDKGVYDKKLIVSAGCSNTVAMPRVNNPREIILVTSEK